MGGLLGPFGDHDIDLCTNGRGRRGPLIGAGTGLYLLPIKLVWERFRPAPGLTSLKVCMST